MVIAMLDSSNKVNSMAKVFINGTMVVNISVSFIKEEDKEKGNGKVQQEMNSKANISTI